MKCLHQPVERTAGVCARSGRRAQARRVRLATARAINGSQNDFQKSGLVVGVGGCGIDYMASVARFPDPDQKLRTERLEVHGGGNCGNALTAVSRLGLSTRILSKIGDDALGDTIIGELQADGVNTEFLLRSPGPSPFTYIIVDRKGGTRTCIHTPGAPLGPSEVTPELCNSLLKDASIVYFDGRLTEAALVVAMAARKAGIPVLVEAERLRPNLELLMAEADYIITSAHFPRDWTGEECIGDALLATALRLPLVKFVVMTLGKRGSILLEVSRDACSASSPQAELQATIEELFQQLEDKSGNNANGQRPACTSANGVAISPGGVVCTPQPLRLAFNRKASHEQQVLEQALAASALAATLNAEEGSGAQYAYGGGTVDPEDVFSSDDIQLCAKVYVASCAAISEADFVDSTGAGDAFVGSVLYSLVTGKGREDMLKLGATVASCKCTALGARPGLPYRENLDPRML